MKDPAMWVLESYADAGLIQKAWLKLLGEAQESGLLRFIRSEAEGESKPKVDERLTLNLIENVSFLSEARQKIKTQLVNAVSCFCSVVNGGFADEVVRSLPVAVGGSRSG